MTVEHCSFEENFCFSPTITVNINCFKNSGSKKRRAGDVSEHYASSAQEEALRPGFGLNLRELPVSIMLLLRNPTFVFLTICDGMEALMIAAFIQFSPKLLESIYRVTPQVASMIAGVLLYHSFLETNI